MLRFDVVLAIRIVFASAAPRAVATSASGCASRCDDVGASRMGCSSAKPQQRPAGIDVRRIHQHPRLQLQRIQRRAIPPQRNLVARPAVEVLPRRHRQLPLRRRLVVPQTRQHFTAPYRRPALGRSATSLGRRVTVRRDLDPAPAPKSPSPPLPPDSPSKDRADPSPHSLPQIPRAAQIPWHNPRSSRFA